MLTFNNQTVLEDDLTLEHYSIQDQDLLTIELTGKAPFQFVNMQDQISGEAKSAKENELNKH